MDEYLTCAYCREPLPEHVGPDYGFCRCPTCRRPLLVKERILGLRLAKGGVLWVTMLIMVLCPVACLAGSPLLFYSQRAFLALMTAGIAVMGATLGHEGWLSLATGVDVSPRRERLSGFLALFAGLVKLVTGAAVAGAGLYGLIHELVR